MARFNQLGGAATGRHNRRRVGERMFRTEAEARAEAQQGRKVNVRAIAAGVHSHDGKTWGSDR